ncbi:glucosaminidase domain-containing protein [Psychrobacillus sp.]|uniref:glucosaminidase domain-containing protein n=1 Tax=Psychrobacillus sp. TaxID=1871623 RepID=UPI0028BEFD45|nr:glucosaminidase domain-containing protein [Psychrobacillus sp.]
MRKGKIALLAITFIAAIVIYFMSDKEIAIPIEKIKEIQTIVDETSHGKVQVDWRNVAAVAHTEYGLDSITTNEIESITARFIEKKENDYVLKDLEEVTSELEFNKRKSKQVSSFLEQLASEVVVTTENSMQRLFIESIQEAAIHNYKSYKILPSITIAQAILESDWGRSGLSTQYHNLFGIKGFNWSGKTTNLSTNEFYDQTIKDDFRMYENIYESVEDHGLFLSENPRYGKHGVFTSRTYMEQANALQEAGYSTIENEKGEKIYSKQLIELIQQYQLQLLDSHVQL